LLDYFERHRRKYHKLVDMAAPEPWDLPWRPVEVE